MKQSLLDIDKTSALMSSWHLWSHAQSQANQRSHTEWGGFQESSSVMSGDLWIADGFQGRKSQFSL